MKINNIENQRTAIKKITANSIKVLLVFLFISTVSCADDGCEYPENYDCDTLELNIGDTCDSNGDGVLNGTVNEFCECFVIGEPM